MLGHETMPSYEWSSKPTTTQTLHAQPATELPLNNPSLIYELPEMQVHELPEQ